ncbi:MAG TPA: ABC transporter permease [Candidatus Limiplasma sp.]|nr:ABC transporter permease [Candidatus Limiplasma sp.]
MIRKIFAEIHKMFRYWRTHKAMALVSIFPPLLLCLLFVGAFQTTGEADLVVVNEDANSVVTQEFLEVLASKEGTIPYFNLTFAEEQDAETMLEMHDTFGVLTIPAGFGDSVAQGDPIDLQVYFTAIHEDISKNVRLGIEARIYDFVKQYDLDTGERPGIVVTESLQQKSLARADYMMGGIAVWTMMFFGLLIGGSLGASERQEGTDVYIRMTPDGAILSVLGKWIAAIVISALMMVVMTAVYVWVFGLAIATARQLAWFALLFLAIVTIFSFPGVLYGAKVGDFRLIPGPMIILSITLWILSGALNPLEFSAGSAVFQYLPTAAGIRLITCLLFDRGEAFVSSSAVTLAVWLGLTAVWAAVWTIRTHRVRLKGIA